jgi:tetratricopeptide (TPR) repeat protein
MVSLTNKSKVDPMEKARVWQETVRIGTYGIGKPNKNPMFFEKRVYQGSSGKVYPYPVIDTLVDEKKDKPYIGLYLENEYIRILVLPELGGKIHSAVDKTNGYDFVYHNEVIKPALVGLLGPWVSGGIEFNWPQHHRPTTFMPTDFMYGKKDGHVFVKLFDHDRMYGTEVITTISLHEDKSYLQIEASLFNPTSEAQTFLWWANPAVAVNDDTQSIFPPDVNAVFDHGKRAVSTFPIATGEYYKHDYSQGVDISRYKNIPVPTSYMAYKSKYDFVGGYDYGKEAGLLHIADHHISPGKKQWTWGNGDFGKAWDRNLTDTNGPYIELMTGVYTDNQPDFSWLQPYEEKHFTQYFMPYRQLGAVKNASIEVLLNCEVLDGVAFVSVYATSEREVRITLKGDREYLDENALVSPKKVFVAKVADLSCKDFQLILSVYDSKGVLLLSYQKEEDSVKPIPEPARPAKDPAEILSCEELYLTGQHIEQYRHATYLPESYYCEGLKRDSGDIRLNNAYGVLLLRRGLFKEAEVHFHKAIERLTLLHPNPYDSEAYVNLGFALEYQGDDEAAYDAFFKATWSQSQAGIGYYKLASISCKKGRWEQALDFVEHGLQYNCRNLNARQLKVLLLFLLGRDSEGIAYARETLEQVPFDYISAFLLFQKGEELSFDLQKRMGKRVESYIEGARLLSSFGQYQIALDFCSMYQGSDVLLSYHKAYHAHMLGLDDGTYLVQARESDFSLRFANTLFDQIVLCHAIKQNEKDWVALYLLGNLLYDKREYEKAYSCWVKSRACNPMFPTVHRNLALVLFNKHKAPKEALREMEESFCLNPTDARVFLELDQLYKKLGFSNESRLERYELHPSLIVLRDDLKTEYVTLLNLCGNYRKAYDFLLSHLFHPWEGGEGKVSSQYVFSLRELARQAMDIGEYENALVLLEESLVFPINLGEGKLEGRKDNDVHYLLGLCHRNLGRAEEAVRQLSLASIGSQEIASMMFYNDQSPEMILFQALACEQLGDKAGAQVRYNKLLDYGKHHLLDTVKIDYFAVSLPDLQLFEEDLDKKNRVHCNYLMALGFFGKNEKEQALFLLEKVLAEDCSHMGAILLLEMLQKSGK